MLATKKIDELILRELNQLTLDTKQEVLRYIKNAKAKKTEKTIAILNQTAGSWHKLIDGEKLKKNIYTNRLVSTRQEVKF